MAKLHTRKVNSDVNPNVILHCVIAKGRKGV